MSGGRISYAVVGSGLVLSALIGAAIGVGGYTFAYARGASYFTDDAAACANCHVMRDHYDAWLRSSHRVWAACNDCHTPDGFIAKYATKASNGFWHALAFTSGSFHEPVQIKPRNLEITEAQCRRCHGELTWTMEATRSGAERVSCVRCHDSVGHVTRK